MVRGTGVLPHGTGKTKKICVIAAGEKIKEAEEAGADYFGGDEIIERIAGGWIDLHRHRHPGHGGVGKLGASWHEGPRPNKSGTVTFDVRRPWGDQPAGVPRGQDEHRPLDGARSPHGDGSSKIRTFIRHRPRQPPPPGKYVRSMYVSSTMGPSFKITEDILEKQERRSETKTRKIVSGLEGGSCERHLLPRRLHDARLPVRELRKSSENAYSTRSSRTASPSGPSESAPDP
jgi:large subunit ribosomal protein L1